MDFSGILSLRLLCECSPAFCSANVHWFYYWAWDGKGCLGVSQSTLCLGEKKLPARLSASCQLKELMTQIQAKHWAEAKERERSLNSEENQCQTASPNIQLRRSHHAGKWGDCVFILCFEYTHTRSHKLPPLFLSHRHILPWSEILRLLYTSVKQNKQNNNLL